MFAGIVFHTRCAQQPYHTRTGSRSAKHMCGKSPVSYRFHRSERRKHDPDHPRADHKNQGPTSTRAPRKHTGTPRISQGVYNTRSHSAAHICGKSPVPYRSHGSGEHGPDCTRADHENQGPTIHAPKKTYRYTRYKSGSSIRELMCPEISQTVKRGSKKQASLGGNTRTLLVLILTYKRSTYFR